MLSKISKFDVNVDHPSVDTSAQIRCGYVSAGKVRIRQQRQGKDTILQRYSTDTHVDWNKASPIVAFHSFLVWLGCGSSLTSQHFDSPISLNLGDQ